MQNLPPDTLVQFQVNAFIEPDNIILAGMSGVVIDHPHAHLICTPGISTMVIVLGRDEPYGYSNEWFTPVEEEPDEDDLDASNYAAQNAFEIYEKEYDYTGFIKIGNKIHPQEKYFEEMKQLTNKVLEWKKDEKYSAQIDGNLKRFRKILRAFKNHPHSEDAQSLEEQLKTVDSSSQDLDTWMIEINKWVAEAEKMERVETQSDRIVQAKKEGNSTTIPYSASE